MVAASPGQGGVRAQSAYATVAAAGFFFEGDGSMSEAAEKMSLRRSLLDQEVLVPAARSAASVQVETEEARTACAWTRWKDSSSLVQVARSPSLVLVPR